MSSSQVTTKPTCSLTTSVDIVDDGVDHHPLGSMGYGFGGESFGDQTFSFSAPVFCQSQDETLHYSEEMTRSSSYDSNSSSISMEVKASERRRRKHIENARQSIAPKCLPEV
jgi:hypothetical protein